jgi:hypothetical protein
MNNMNLHLRNIITGLRRFIAWAEPKLQDKWKYITIALALFVLFIGLRIYFAPSSVVVNLLDSYEFTGESVEISGHITANCRCSLQASINGEYIALDADGAFSTVLDVPADEDTGNFTIITTVTGKGSMTDSIIQEFEGSYNRKKTHLRMVDVPKEWGEKEIHFQIEVMPDSEVNISDAPYPIEWSEIEGNQDDLLRNATVKADFDTAYDNDRDNLQMNQNMFLLRTLSMMLGELRRKKRREKRKICCVR